MRRGVGTLASPSSSSHERHSSPARATQASPLTIPTTPAPTGTMLAPSKNLPLKALPPPLRGRFAFSITLVLAGYFADDFFVGDVTFDGGLTDEEESCTNDE